LSFPSQENVTSSGPFAAVAVAILAVLPMSRA
jgi:hypothetical protein